MLLRLGPQFDQHRSVTAPVRAKLSTVPPFPTAFPCCHTRPEKDHRPKLQRASKEYIARIRTVRLQSMKSSDEKEFEKVDLCDARLSPAIHRSRTVSGMSHRRRRNRRMSTSYLLAREGYSVVVLDDGNRWRNDSQDHGASGTALSIVSSSNAFTARRFRLAAERPRRPQRTKQSWNRRVRVNLKGGWLFGCSASRFQRYSTTNWPPFTERA